jgi:hypothetical protein
MTEVLLQDLDPSSRSIVAANASRAQGTFEVRIQKACDELISASASLPRRTGRRTFRGENLRGSSNGGIVR